MPSRRKHTIPLRIAQIPAINISASLLNVFPNHTKFSLYQILLISLFFVFLSRCFQYHVRKKSGLFVPHEFIEPTGQRTSTAYAVANTMQPSTASMVLPPFLTVILFVAMLPRFWHIACSASLHSQRAKPTPDSNKETLHSIHPHRSLCQYKNWRK